jgi:hypothetical protein
MKFSLLLLEEVVVDHFSTFSLPNASFSLSNIFISLCFSSYSVHLLVIYNICVLT